MPSGLSGSGFVRAFNALVVGLLDVPLVGRLVRRGLVEVRYVGRRSGKTFEIPVGYRRSGDTITIRMQGGRTIRAIELRVTPRQTSGHLVTGSLWIDPSNGTVVQALYRLSRPLDVETEARVKVAVDKLCQNRTTFIIAHRLSTVRDADIVLFMDQGEVIESGSFDELARQNGRFTSLLKAGGLKLDDDTANVTPFPRKPEAA